MPWTFLPRRRRSQPIQERPLLDAQRPPLQIDRKIVQDPSSLLDSQAQDALPLGLTPSTRLPSASARDHVRHHSKIIDSPPVSARSRIPKIASGGEWSTFGRKRQQHSTTDDDPGGSRSPSPTRARLGAYNTSSTFTLSRLTNPSRISAATPEASSPPQSPDVQSSRRSSPTDTMSSKPNPQTPQKQTSDTAATASLVTDLTVNREPASGSPHTFGHPTPPSNAADFSVADPLPPPLPPLDHPELTALHFARTKSMSTDQAKQAFRDRSNTLPTNRRSPRKQDLFPSLSLRLERSIRHQLSLPQAFGAEDRPDERRRTRTASNGSRQRRASADWSSYHATVGVSSHANQAWPAEVSREILRLSLSGQDTVSGSSGKHETRTRGQNADPARRSDRGTMSPSFLPFPRPSRPVSPPPLEASATLTDGREITPSRPHSLQFSLGNSDRPSRFTMAYVKRSLSAIESRRSPNNHASGATLSDPVPTSNDAAPRAPQPSLARTPSSTLFPGRVFPTNAPMTSIRGEPSTPTPESRHLSDKSRGKRKAEDNIDVTPPEQKKEGQRATFLLPTESRGQRVSSSSNAPSSYHRKRARLSSTSPFATPVQSRPASMHETPRSANRSHHFASLSSGTGVRLAPRTPSRAASTRSHQPPTPSTAQRHERHQSMSQVSIPISAFISPHAPSISRSAKFHMRDPRRPPKKPSDTPWGLRFATEDEPGSPIQAWCFFLGFLMFPLWWTAGLFLSVPTTRIAGDIDTEKGVAIDDPQIEHDAKIWRFRCRVMAVVSLFTYIPFIVLVAIFAPR